MKKPAAFLDRDGVICEYVPELCKIDQFVLRPGIEEAVRLLNQAGYYVFVVTNQPDVARGKISVVYLESIHQKMKDLVAIKGGHFDQVYYCPHRIDGVIPELSYECDCRKPRTGMLEQAAKEFEIDKSKSFMIGDTWRDVECARNFGIQAYAVTGGGGYPYPSNSQEAKTQPDQLFDSVLSAVQSILKRTQSIE